MQKLFTAAFLFQNGTTMNTLSRSLAVLAIVTLAGQAAAADHGAPLRVMSFNVRNSNARDGTNAWKYRREYFFQVIEHFSPSLIGFQEVLADQYDDIVKRMTD